MGKSCPGEGGAAQYRARRLITSNPLKIIAPAAFLANRGWVVAGVREGPGHRGS